MTRWTRARGCVCPRTTARRAPSSGAGGPQIQRVRAGAGRRSRQPGHESRNERHSTNEGGNDERRVPENHKDREGLSRDQSRLLPGPWRQQPASVGGRPAVAKGVYLYRRQATSGRPGSESVGVPRVLVEDEDRRGLGSRQDEGPREEDPPLHGPVRQTSRRPAGEGLHFPGRRSRDGRGRRVTSNLTPSELARLQRLIPEARERVWRVIEDMAARGFDVYVGQTSRTADEVAKAATEGRASIGMKHDWHELGRAADLRQRKAGGGVNF